MSNDKALKKGFDMDLDMKEPYVFISYAHKDSKSVLPMIAELQKNYNVWYDDGIDPGTEWDENIAKHIENCNLFFACITKNYLQSSNCKDEIDFARSQNKTRVLIYFEDVELPSGMKMRLNRLQNIHKYVYTSEEDFYKKLYQSEGLLECLKQRKPTTKPKKESKPKTEKNKSQQTDTDNKLVETSTKKISSILFDNVDNTALVTDSKTKGLTTCNSKNNYNYTCPPLSLLKDTIVIEDKDSLNEFVTSSIVIIQNVIKNMTNYDVEVVQVQHGSTFTRFDLTLPVGVSIKKIEVLADDLTIQLSAFSKVRIVHVPYTDRIGIEVPNKQRIQVDLKDLLSDKDFVKADPSKCPFIVGKDVTGNVVFSKVADLVHVLLAGVSGSGKSVFARSLLLSLMFKTSPKDLRMILCDPKGGVDFSCFTGAPHLLTGEVLEEVTKIENALAWAIKEMESRYYLFHENKVAKLDDYNNTVKDKDRLPRILIFIDEFSYLMESCRKSFIEKVTRIAQKARGAGIHLVISTQRPSVDIVNGAIKVNLSTRMALRLQTAVDSRMILDVNGAENLLMQGDMLYYSATSPYLQRVQVPYVSVTDVYKVLDYVKNNNEVYFDEKIKEEINGLNENDKMDNLLNEKELDINEDLKIKVLKFIVESKKTSISATQREFKIGFNKAARIHESLIKEGYVTRLSDFSCQINITIEEFNAKFGGV